MTTVERKSFGNLDSGEKVEKIILTNKNGVMVEVRIFNNRLSFFSILVITYLCLIDFTYSF